MLNNDKIILEQYRDLINIKGEDYMNKTKRNITKEVFVTYLYTINPNERLDYVKKSEIKNFLGEARPIIITQTELGNYVREIRTGKLFPVAHIENRSEWSNSKIKYNGIDEDNQYVVTEHGLPFYRRPNYNELYAYYTLYDDEKFNDYLSPIETKNKTKKLK